MGKVLNVTFTCNYKLLGMRVSAKYLKVMCMLHVQ